MKLIIGNQNYSSWSLRPWLLLKQFNIPFEQHKILLFTEDMLEQMAPYCPNNKVPVLITEDSFIWDSLAICEYINEQLLEGKALPQDPLARAKARSICAEMHSSFPALRHEMPMNCRRQPGQIDYSDECQTDIDRILALWQDCLAQSQGEFLFGQFSLVDAFYMPVVSRFNSYQVSVPTLVKQYMERMLALPSYQEWLSDAQNEEAVIECEEV